MTTEITYLDLQSGAKPAGEVEVIGGGTVRAADLSNWRTAWLRFGDATSQLNEMLPRPLKRGSVGREIPLFVDCDLTGLQCWSFDPGITRFLRCRFDAVTVKANIGVVHAHFEECTFSGRWEASFDARPATRDPSKQVIVRGNDFAGCTEFSMQGGIPRGQNTLDPSVHVVVWRGGARWADIRDIAQEDAYLRNMVTSVEGRGPFYLAQDWAIIERGWVADDLWLRLRDVIDLDTR